MSEEAKAKKGGCLKFALWGGGGFVALISVLVFVGDLILKNEIKACNNGGETECKSLIEKNDSLSENDFASVTNPIFKSIFDEYKLEKANKERIEKEQKDLEIAKSSAEKDALECIKSAGSICLSIKTEFLNDELLASVKPLIDKQKKLKEEREIAEAKIREEKEKAEAKFKAEGWWQPTKGIFVRWCNNASSRYPEKGDCPRTDAYLDTVWRMMVWCRDTRCGDIYAKVNLSQTNDGPVIGWTNDTAYGDYGQKVILTFQSSANVRYADLVEFSTY